MKFIILIALVVVAASALPQAPSPQILRQEAETNQDGSWKYSFASDDGTAAQAEGHQDGPGEEAGQEQKGSYDYKDNEGKDHHVDWTAGKAGFQAFGDDIPK